MYNLRLFFQAGKKPNGTYMSENENVLNATLRNLSCHTDQELLRLRDEAQRFATLCEETIQERIADDDEKPVTPMVPTRTERLLESGYLAYAMEEGY